MYDVIAALPEHTVASARMLYAEMRKAGQLFRDASVRAAVDDLIVAGRLIEVSGKRGAKGYRAVLTASQESCSMTTSASVCVSHRVPLRGWDAVGRSHVTTASGTQWDAVGSSQ